MKQIITLFIFSAALAMSFDTTKIGFPDLFKMTYERSFEGLEKLKDMRTGEWSFDNASTDFDIYEVKFDVSTGLHTMHFVKDLDSEATALQFMNRYSIQLERLLPNGKFEINPIKSSKNRIVYEYRSSDVKEKAMYPVAEILTEGDKTSGRMTIKLTEPMHRKSVSND